MKLDRENTKFKNMKKTIYVAFLIALLPQFIFGQEFDLKKLDDYLKKEMYSCRIPGLAVGIIQDGEIVYCKGFGKNIGDNSQINAKSPFILASLTKSFTGLAISQLEIQGRLKYTDKIKDYLPFFTLKDVDYQDSITINHLLDHRSGIPGISSYKTNREDLDLEEKARRLKNVKGKRNLGHFGYANDNYALLGLIIEKVSKQSYQEYVRKQILGPLNMSNTFFSQEEAVRHNMAKGHQLIFGFPVPSKITYHKANLPNGGILSSTKDLCKYLQSHIGNLTLMHSQLLLPLIRPMIFLNRLMKIFIAKAGLSANITVKVIILMGDNFQITEISWVFSLKKNWVWLY